MARNVYIPVSDHNVDPVCSAYYNVRYRLTSGGGWTQLSNQQPIAYGSPAEWVIQLENLSDDVEYQAGITRACCGGVLSSESLVTFTTTP